MPCCASCGISGISDTCLDCALEISKDLTHIFPLPIYDTSRLLIARDDRLRDR